MPQLYDDAEAQEKLPTILAYEQKFQSPPVSNARFYLTPVNGGSFVCPLSSGTLIKFEIPCGTFGSHMNPQETAIAFTINNTSGANLTLDNSAFSLIDRIDVYYGSMLISSIANYANFATLMTDFTGGAAPHYMKGQASTTNGAVIASGASDTFVLPILNCIGSMAMKAIPLSELRDSLKLEILLNPSMDFGVYSAAPTAGVTISSAKLWCTNIQLGGDVHSALVAKSNGKLKVPVFDVESFRTSLGQNTGAFTYTIPCKVASCTAIFVTLRENGVFNNREQRALSRTRSSLSDFRFRIGSVTLPSAQVDCSGSANEARAELQRAFNQISLPTSDSYVTSSLYALGGTTANAVGAQGCFCFALNLSAYGAADLLSDGRNIRLEALTVDLRFNGNNVPLQMDVYCMEEKVLIIENASLSFKN